MCKVNIVRGSIIMMDRYDDDYTNIEIIVVSDRYEHDDYNNIWHTFIVKPTLNGKKELLRQYKERVLENYPKGKMPKCYKTEMRQPEYGEVGYSGAGLYKEVKSIIYPPTYNLLAAGKIRRKNRIATIADEINTARYFSQYED